LKNLLREELTFSGSIPSMEQPNGKLVSTDYIVDKLYKKKIVNRNETILVIHGARWKKPGLTNSITLVSPQE
jgi:hypothetical protein